MSRKILLQRIYMRNEQFGFPLSAARIREIEAAESSRCGSTTPAWNSGTSRAE
jgi:hypothetical protein